MLILLLVLLAQGLRSWVSNMHVVNDVEFRPFWQLSAMERTTLDDKLGTKYRQSI